MSSKPVSKPRLQRSSITRRLAAFLALWLVFACTDLRSQIQSKTESPVWKDAADYLELFVPTANRSAYRAYVSPLDLQATLGKLLADPGVLKPPGAWRIQAQIPYDAFGLSGSYNRWKVAGLYRSRRALVARGPRLDDQGHVESWTLIAPYPDPSLQRLEPGTLIIVLRIPSSEAP